MSGKTPHQLRIFDNNVSVFERLDAKEMWPARLKEAGYFCSSGGKMHHKYKPLPQRQHDVFYSDARKRFTDDMRIPAGVERIKHGGHRNGWATAREEDDDVFHDAQSANSAVQFLKEYADEKPFYREVGFFSPHTPHYTPNRFKTMYDRRALRQPEEWAGGYSKNDYAEDQFPVNVDPEDGPWWRMSVRNYFSAMSHGDYHLGRIWDALKASRHAKNTIVIIISDHGFHLGNLNRFKKTTVWEQAASVPILIHDPRSPVEQSIEEPVALLDVGPTVLDYVELDPMTDCVGTSLRDYVNGQGDRARGIPTFFFDNVSVRTGDYRIVRFDDGSTQFFDLKKDYWQLSDLGRDHTDFAAAYDVLVQTCADYGYHVPPLDVSGNTAPLSGAA